MILVAQPLMRTAKKRKLVRNNPETPVILAGVFLCALPIDKLGRLGSYRAMTDPNPKQEFVHGMRDQLPLQLGVIPFGMVFGVLGMASGLTEWQTILMSSIIFGGASQVVFAQLWMAGAAPVIVGSSVTVLNLRHVLYSVTIAKYLRNLSLGWRIILGYLLTDEAFAVSIKRFEQNPVPRHAHYHLLGSGLTLWTFWQISTAAGVWLGTTLPAHLNLDFAIPLTFIAIVAPILRKMPQISAAAASGLVAVFGQSLPWNIWIIAAALAGIMTGAIVERGQDPS